ncbi:amidohydrolase family protein, partial [Frankia canadensis]|uniref:amidohydrolase family protein n=1 Tax=Frankia canadensis TaxID=1836972 RepID=UPI000C79EA80
MISTSAGTGVDRGQWTVVGRLDDPFLATGGAVGRWRLTVDGGVITSLRPLTGPGPASPCADAHGDGGEPALVLVPLLCNGHDHGRGAGTVDAGIPDAPLEEWLPLLSRPVRRCGQDELVGLAAAAMLRAGIGAAVLCVNPQTSDVEGEVLAAAHAAAAAGIRAAVVYPVHDTMEDPAGRSRTAPGAGRAATETVIAAAERVAARVEGVGCEVQLGPVGPQWVAEDTLARLAAHSAETGRRLHLHLLESPGQRHWADRVYPDGLLPALDRLGVLSPLTTVAHGTHLRDDELALLDARGVTLVLNASSNLRLASGVAPVARAVARMGRVGLGLDGLALSDDHDGWAELRLARGLWQGQTRRRVPGADALALAAAGARAALGSAAPASPAQGGPADFALVDVGPWRHLLGHPAWPLADILTAAAGPAQVREVWVAGRRPRPHRAARG